MSDSKLDNKFTYELSVLDPATGLKQRIKLTQSFIEELRTLHGINIFDELCDSLNFELRRNIEMLKSQSKD